MIEIRYDCWLLDEKLYDVFIKNELRDILESELLQMKACEAKINDRKVRSLDFDKGIVRLTPLEKLLLVFASISDLWLST